MAMINCLITPSIGSMVQIVLSTLPILALLTYYLYLATKRQGEECYSTNIQEDDIAALCHLVPLRDMVFVFLGVGFFWTCLVGYLVLFVDKRKALIEEYLAEGHNIIGNVHYRGESHLCCRRSDYGNVVYPHPNYGKLPVFIRRQVRVVERYTRERIPLLYLPNYSFSAQPKQELIVDSEIFRTNEKRLQALKVISLVWVAFCHLAPLYLLIQLFALRDMDIQDYTPDYDGHKVSIWYSLITAIFTPFFALGINYLMWTHHRRWMLTQHKVLEEGDTGDSGDDISMEGRPKKRAYVPPVPKRERRSSRKSKKEEEFEI